MTHLSLAIAAKNAEDTLEACLLSVKGLVSEIVLVDDRSSDRTCEIARRHGAKVFEKELTSFGEQKQFAIEKTSGDWILLMDSDETVSPEMAESVRSAVSARVPGADAYRVRRKNIYFGRWLRYGGKYPDYQIRLFKKGAVRYSDDLVHEKPVGAGTVGTLDGWINHFSYPDVKTWVAKLEFFARFRAEALFQKGVQPSVKQFFTYCVFRPVWRFDRKYFLKLGFLDGLPGLLACLHDALTEILTYTVLCQKCNKLN
jgi:glycosyltransferase involved in cell wall biosynthesis